MDGAIGKENLSFQSPFDRHVTFSRTIPFKINRAFTQLERKTQGSIQSMGRDAAAVGFRYKSGGAFILARAAAQHIIVADNIRPQGPKAVTYLCSNTEF